MGHLLIYSGTTGFEPMRTLDYQTRKYNLGTQDNKSHVMASTFIIDMQYFTCRFNTNEIGLIRSEFKIMNNKYIQANEQ